jgi:hypothetical protein
MTADKLIVASIMIMTALCVLLVALVAKGLF